MVLSIGFAWLVLVQPLSCIFGAGDRGKMQNDVFTSALLPAGMHPVDIESFNQHQPLQHGLFGLLLVAATLGGITLATTAFSFGLGFSIFFLGFAVPAIGNSR